MPSPIAKPTQKAKPHSAEDTWITIRVAVACGMLKLNLLRVCGAFIVGTSK